MAETAKAGELLVWSTPECPFPIAYAPQAIDDIRLTVVDAFFSLPRGGVEIGGILLGKWDGERLTIGGYAALECEHAFGPGFTLSQPDKERLAALMAAHAGNAMAPVGWYHSHTRSEIFLSDADQEIHREFFKEAWQVALILKPHTFQPTRAGFFFRDADGGMHAEASYHEFVLMPLMVTAVPARLPFAEAAEAAAASEPPPAPASEPVAAPAKIPPPASSTEAPRAPSTETLRATREPGLWMRVLISLLAVVVLCWIAYWHFVLLPKFQAVANRPAPVAAPLPPGLIAVDSGGQLQIHWNPNSPTVRKATSGVLRITPGDAAPQEFPLNAMHLLSGTFTFARQTERVDLSLTLTQPDGQALREDTIFLAQGPVKAAAEDPAVKEDRDKLAAQVGKMQADLNAEIARNAALRRSVDELSRQLHEQQRGRMLNQAPGKNQ